MIKTVEWKGRKLIYSVTCQYMYRELTKALRDISFIKLYIIALQQQFLRQS